MVNESQQAGEDNPIKLKRKIRKELTKIVDEIMYNKDIKYDFNDSDKLYNEIKRLCDFNLTKFNKLGIEKKLEEAKMKINAKNLEKQIKKEEIAKIKLEKKIENNLKKQGEVKQPKIIDKITTNPDLLKIIDDFAQKINKSELTDENKRTLLYNFDKKRNEEFKKNFLRLKPVEYSKIAIDYKLDTEPDYIEKKRNDPSYKDKSFNGLINDTLKAITTTTEKIAVKRYMKYRLLALLNNPKYNKYINDNRIKSIKEFDFEKTKPPKKEKSKKEIKEGKVKEEKVKEEKVNEEIVEEEKVDDDYVETLINKLGELKSIYDEEGKINNKDKKELQKAYEELNDSSKKYFYDNLLDDEKDFIKLVF